MPQADFQPARLALARAGGRVAPHAGASQYRRTLQNVFNSSGWIWILLVCPAALRTATIELPRGDAGTPITIRAEQAWSWREGQYEVLLLSGGASIKQAGQQAAAYEAVLWLWRFPSSDEPSQVIAWLEGNARVDLQPGGSFRDRQWLGRFATQNQIEVEIANIQPEPATKPPIYRRAKEARRAGDVSPPVVDRHVKPAQFTELPPLDPPETSLPPAESTLQQDPLEGLARAGIKRVQVFPRSSVRWQARSEMNPNNPAEQITTISSGVQVVIESDTEYGTVTIETDRAVIWSRP